jgi:flagellar motor switch/type III secretory pathway protein FliN
MLAAYPWGALEPVTRSALRPAAGVRRALGVDAARLSAALSELLEAPCELVVRRTAMSPAPRSERVLWLSNGSGAVGLEAEPALASFLAARLLRRNAPLVSPTAALPAELEGLLAALAIEAARRASSGEPLTLEASVPVEAVTEVQATFVVDGRPFAVRAHIAAHLTYPLPRRDLFGLGELPLALPLVVAELLLDVRELGGLEPGCAVMLPDGVQPGHGRAHPALLVAPASETAIAVEVRSDGRIVVGEKREAPLAVEREPNQAEGLIEAVLEAPIVVRVEIGAISMSAREWAELSVGDVIETTQRLAAPVVLRVGGREVGRGELVNVEGHVGVRIQELAGGRG